MLIGEMRWGEGTGEAFSWFSWTRLRSHPIRPPVNFPREGGQCAGGRRDWLTVGLAQ
ncbi:hypothetical protein XOCgx_4761 [Xanthomonas oryzae pv. oryzicola]|nr:hypothetical protein XOCgx_4761 [Xanthomonas oryzae pv. oryzicola]